MRYLLQTDGDYPTSCEISLTWNMANIALEKTGRKMTKVSENGLKVSLKVSFWKLKLTIR